MGEARKAEADTAGDTEVGTATRRETDTEEKCGRDDGDNRAVALGEGGSAGAGGLLGGAAGSGVHMTGSSTDTQGVMGLPRHGPIGGGVEGSDGDSKSPLHILHSLVPRLASAST